MHYVCKNAQNESWLTDSVPEKQKGVSPVLYLILHIIFVRPVCGLLLIILGPAAIGQYLDLQTSALE
jgi:hypothetical protein